MRTFLCLALVSLAFAANKPKKDDWRPIFDGSTLEGWQALDHPESWTVKDGAIRGDGPASHLFYKAEKCVNCEFKAEVRINHGGNSGMYVRAAFKSRDSLQATKRRSIIPTPIRSGPAASTTLCRSISN